MIEVKNLYKSYGENAVYSGFDLSLDVGAVTCILGESGCGKTTLLNCIAGLTDYSGEITAVKYSYVFQSPRLIPAISVLDNLKIIGAAEEDCLAMLETVNLKDKASRYPMALSGGEAQRVALARAFLYPSDILLMDEPFSSLDLKTKLRLMDAFKELKKEGKRGAIFVTHDVDEAIYLADRIVVIKGGKILADENNAADMPFGASSAMRDKIVNVLLER